MRPSLRGVLLSILAVALIAGLTLYSLTRTHPFTPLGTLALVGIGTVGLLVLFVMDRATELIEWMRYGVLPGVVVVIGVLLFTDTFGPLTTESETERIEEQRTAADIAYTDAIVVQVDAKAKQPRCVAIDVNTLAIAAKLPAGVTVSTESNQCVVVVDWKLNHTHAFPRRNSQNALVEFDTFPLGDTKQLMLRFPADADFYSYFFFYNTDEAHRAVPLPGWVSTAGGNFVANATK